MLVIYCPCVGKKMVYHSNGNNCVVRCFVDQLGIQYVLPLQIFSRFDDIFFMKKKKQINFMIRILSVNLLQFIISQLGNECLCMPQ